MFKITMDGVDFLFYDGEISPKILNALYNKTYEKDEAYCVRQLVKPGDRVLEIGAGIGYITTLLSRMAGVKLWSYDANPELFRLLERTKNLNNNENASIHIGAFSAKEGGELDFYVREEFWMSSSYEAQGEYTNKIKVEVANIDEFIQSNGINCLVMDIEGGEKDILENSELLGIERICVEFHPRLYGIDGKQSIISRLERKGYRIDSTSSRNECISFVKGAGYVSEE